MQRLAGVFLHMNAFDLHSKLFGPLIGFDYNIQIAVDANGLVKLRSLKILWHIGIEIVFTCETRKWGDRTIEGQANQYCALDCFAVNNW